MAAAHKFFLFLSNTNTKINKDKYKNTKYKDKYKNTNTLFKNIKGAKDGCCAQLPYLAPFMFLNIDYIIVFVLLYLSLFTFVFVFDKRMKNVCAAAIFGSFDVFSSW